MARFRNDTGSVLVSQEFGVIPIGEFDAVGYDPEVHGVIPGCVWLDAPEGDNGTQPPKPSGKRGKAAQTEEAAP